MQRHPRPAAAAGRLSPRAESRLDWVKELDVRLRAAREAEGRETTAEPLERRGPPSRLIDLERRAQFGRFGFGAQ